MGGVGRAADRCPARSAGAVEQRDSPHLAQDGRSRHAGCRGRSPGRRARSAAPQARYGGRDAGSVVLSRPCHPRPTADRIGAEPFAVDAAAASRDRYLAAGENVFPRRLSRTDRSGRAGREMRSGPAGRRGADRDGSRGNIRRTGRVVRPSRVSRAPPSFEPPGRQPRAATEVAMIPIIPIAGAVLSELSSLGSEANEPTITTAIGGDKPKVSFTDTLKTAIDRVNDQIAVASGQAASYASGNHSVPLSSVMISLEKANLAFQTAVTVRDRVTDAYSSVMNMQV